MSNLKMKAVASYNGNERGFIVTKEGNAWTCSVKTIERAIRSVCPENNDYVDLKLGPTGVPLKLVGPGVLVPA